MKVITRILCITLMLAMTMPFSAQAAIVEIPVAEQEPDSQALEAVIKLVKPKLDVPEEYTEFEWYFSGETVYSAAFWELTWSAKDGNGHISVSCDGKGRIVNYYHYIPSGDEKNIPNFLKQELLGVAQDFVKRISPEANLVYRSSQGYYSDYNGAYTYYFVREENGLEYTNNTAGVRINYTTGEVTSYNLTYDYDVELEANENLITPEKAREILATEQEMKLSYVLNTQNVDGKKIYKAVLVYSPEHSYIAVDAKTGEIYFETSNISELGAGADKIVMGGIMNDAASKEESADSEEGYRLTEEELAQLGVLDSLIKREQAIKVVTENKDLYLDDTLAVISADLDTRYDYKNDTDEKQYVWNISFTTPLSDISYKYASATVDASTGELLYYFCQLKNYRDYENVLPEINYTKEECIEIFESFMSKALPDKYPLTGKTTDNETNVIYRVENEDGGYDNTYGAYRFSKQRENEGIPFTYDGIYATVDAITGKISEFSYSWYEDITFESPSDAISKGEALGLYLGYSEFDTYYERYDHYTPRDGVDTDSGKYYSINELYTKDSVARIVYKSNSASSIGRISALTGEAVTYSGLPVEEAYEGEISDIGGHWAQYDIQLLCDIAVIKNEESYRPDEAITQAELEQMINVICSIYKYDEAAGNTVTRLDAIKYAVKSLGYEKIAELSDIYKTDYADKDKVPESDIGYIAIAHGLKIVDGDAQTNTIRPGDNLTRAEAARLVTNIIKAK